MRIASYNIRKAVGLDWRRDSDRVLAVLVEIDADVVVLQEADKRLGRREGVLPRAELARLGYRMADVATRADSHGWHGNAVMLRDGLPLAESGRIALPTLEPRGAVMARLEAPALTVIGVHLSLAATVRTQQLRHLGRMIDGPTVVAGDFNHWGNDIAPLTRLGRVVAPGPSFHSSFPVASLDKFILAGLGPEKRAFVHDSDKARRASDHLPIVLELG